MVIVPAAIVPGERVITTRFVEFEYAGMTCLAGLPAVSGDAPRTVIDGIGRRWLTTVSGRCPCGALRRLPDPHEVDLGGAPQTYIAHERECPAGDSVLGPAVEAWLDPAQP